MQATIEKFAVMCRQTLQAAYIGAEVYVDWRAIGGITEVKTDSTLSREEDAVYYAVHRIGVEIADSCEYWVWKS